MDKYITKEITDFHRLLSTVIYDGTIPDKKILNNTQLHIAMYLLRNQDRDVCQKELEAEIHLKKASITGTLDSLEEKGIIVRVECKDDKRKNFIKLTDKALEMKSQIMDRIDEVNLRVTKNIHEEDVEKFLEVLEKMKGNLKK